MKADTGSEVSLFISPPNVELHISDRAIKERRLPSRRLHRPSPLRRAACFPPGYRRRASWLGLGLPFADYLVLPAFWRCELPSPVSLVSEIPLADLSCRWHLV